jgi:signal transduction histidine kinase/CheY-like chemotaxis protein
MGFFVRSSLGTKTTVWLGLILTSVLLLSTVMNVSRQRTMLLHKQEDSAQSIGNLILSGIRHPMLSGDQDVVQKQFDEFSKELKGIVVLHLTDDKGIIRRSTDRLLIGKVPMAEHFEQALAGKEVHGVEIRKRTGLKDYSLLVPIFNEKACFACHGKENKVLGVLRIALEWDSVMADANSTRNWNIFLSLLALVVISLMMFLFLSWEVIAPIRRLQEGMAAVAAGNMDAEVVSDHQDEIGALTRFFNTMIQERKKVDEQLALAHQRQQQIIEFLPDSTFAINQEGKVIAWNKAVEEMSGVKAEAILGKGDYEYALPFYGVRRPILIDLVLKSDEEVQKNYQIMKKENGALVAETIVNLNGQARFLWGVAVPLYDIKGSCVGAIESVRDITELKKAEAALLGAKADADKANQVKSQFLANMSHEIRTPLNAVIGFSEMLKSTPLDAVQSDYISSIQEAGAILVTLINDILDISKIEASEVALEEIDFDLESLLESVIKIVRGRFIGTEVELFYNFEAGTERYYKGDPGRIKQVVMNLLNNAIKFTAEGQIEISVKNEALAQEGMATLVVSVKDTGVGIAKNQQEQIFKAFVQADVSITRKYGGTGLGLSISKRLIELMGGSIRVVSEIGQGSTFTFTVKVKKGAATDSQEISLAPLEQIKDKSVVVVDDHPLVHQILGLRVVYNAHSGQEALDWLLGQPIPIEIVICDIRMPRMNGYVFAKLFRGNARYATAKLIAVTSEAVPGSRALAQEAGFDAYLPKPVIKSELYKVIRLVFGDKRQADHWQAITRHTSHELCFDGMKVLVAEDNVVNAKLFTAVLTQFGCEIDTCINGLEAVEKLRKQPYDMVLMDVQMPVMDGLEATRLIRQEFSAGLPVIAITAAALKQDQENAMACGMNDFITKPIDFVKLKEKMIAWMPKRIS